MLTGRRLLADGFHRYEAHRRLGHETARCRVRRGDDFTALLLAAQSNGGRGLQYTPSDRKKVAQMLLLALDKRGITWSDTRIARFAGLHRTTVAQARADLQTFLDHPLPQEIEVSRGEQTYSMRRPASQPYIPDPLLNDLSNADRRIEPTRTPPTSRATLRPPTYPGDWGGRQRRRPRTQQQRERERPSEPGTSADGQKSVSGMSMALSAPPDM